MACTSKYTVMLILLAVSIGPKSAHSEDRVSSVVPYTASYAQKYGDEYKRKFGIYSTPVTNAIPKLLTKEEKLYMASASIAKNYSTSSVNMNCPGNSLLIGIKSDFDSESHDRTFAFKCAFLENDKKELLQKTKCDNPTTPDNLNSKTGALEKGESKCSSEQFVGGFKTQKYFANRYQDDRQYMSKCCNLVDPLKQAVKPLSAVSECTTNSYKSGISFDMTCPADMVVTRIVSFYQASNKDRAFNFTCCKAGVQ